MTSLVTIASLAVWCQQEIEDDDAFAIKVVNAASIVVRNEAQHPEWTLAGGTAAPAQAILIAEMLAKRTYLNPDAVTRSSVGPLSETTLDDFARTLELTDAEKDVLHGYWPGAEAPGPGGFWIQPLTKDEATEDLYVGDISGSDWFLPFVAREDKFYFPVLD